MFDFGMDKLPIMQSSIPNLRFRNVMAPQQIQTPAMDAYSSYLNTIPQESDYKPSIWRRIGAAISGAGVGAAQGGGAGFDVASRIVRSPYTNAVQNWAVKEPGLRQAASLENKNLATENAGLRTYYQNQYNQDREARLNKGLDIKENDLKAKRDLDERKFTQNQELTKARIERMGQRKVKQTFFNEGGGIDILFDDGSESHLDTDVYNPTEAQIKAAMDRAKLQASTSRANTGDRIQADKEINDSRIAAGETGPTPTRRNVSAELLDRQDVLQSLATKYPDFIKKKNGKYYTESPDEPGMFGTDLRPKWDTFLEEYNGRVKAPRVTAPSPKVSTPKTRKIDLGNGIIVTEEIK